MREYEFTFVVQPEISEEGLAGLCEKFEGVLERTGGERLFYEDWGRRRLAYEIQKFQKGHYLVLHYLDAGKCVPEIERAARLEDSVLRFLTVLAAEQVADLQARREEAVKFEDERKQKAAERAEREAEEAAARASEAEAAAARAAEAAEAASAKSAESAESADAPESPESEGGGDAQAPSADADAEATPKEEAEATPKEEAEQPA